MKRYVVGDVHGCHDELITLFAKIEEHAAGNDYKLIFVGDYVDRGPNVRGVVNLVMGLEQKGHVALMGNHEDMLLAGEYMYAEATLRSFDASFMELPEYVSNWMRRLPKYYEDDTIIVAHAGVHPGLTLDDQTDTYLLWYRYSAGASAGLAKHFYHGHTPSLSKHPEGGIDRTNVDTGCVYGGLLTAAIVGHDGRPEGFIQVPKRGGDFDMSDALARGWEV